MKRTDLVLIMILTVMLAMSPAVQAAETLLLELDLRHDAAVPRDGKFRVFSTDATSPLGGTILGPYDTGLWVRAELHESCSGHSFALGDEFRGWLLGTITDTAIVQDLHNTVLQMFGISETSTATMLFGVSLGGILGFPDGGEGEKYLCPSGSIDARRGFAYIFLWPNAPLESGRGYYVGDVWYYSEIDPAGQRFKLYAVQPLI